jgi:hypothetical protein
MIEDRSWMYSDWNKRGSYADEWIDKTTAFLDHAFSQTRIVRRPCSVCQNLRCLEDKKIIAIHLCKNGFVSRYEVWTFHGESGTRVVAEDKHDCDIGNVDRMDEMLEAIQADVNEDPPTVEVEAFFKLLKASKDLLHKHIEVTLLDFITRLMAIKFKYFFSNNCYNDLMKLISDILLKPHKVPKNMYQFKKMISALGLKYDKVNPRERLHTPGDAGYHDTPMLDDDVDEVYQEEELPPSFAIDPSAGLDDLVGDVDDLEML